ncbi:hypothetical protein M5C99_01100 [Acidovorax sp. NCPPB 2350]|nr:hypothetical protein M5C99_01100 [Acidovorax sp. NCPPB 2350]
MTAELFDQQAIEELIERVAYELFLIEDVFHLRGIPQRNSPDEYFVLRPHNSPLISITRTSIVTTHDWRHEFLKAGKPLTLVTIFKLIDSLLEWLAEKNGKTARMGFKEKSELEWQSFEFPPLLSSQAWLCELLVGIFRKYYPYRNTIIHHRTFTIEGECLIIDDHHRKLPRVTLTTTDLGLLAETAVSTLRCLEGSWSSDSYRIKRFQFLYDKLAGIIGHTPRFSQKPPIAWSAYLIIQREQGSIEKKDLLVRLDALGHNCDLLPQTILIEVDNNETLYAFMLPEGWIIEAPSILDFKYLRRIGVPTEVTNERLIREALTNTDTQ